MAKPLETDMNPSETQEEFIRCQKQEVCLVGPRGEGKTDAGIMAMTYHASLQDSKYKPIPWAIIRDTWKNLERTTLRSFLFPSPKSFVSQIRSKLRIRDGGRYIELPGVWTAFLFGVDTPDDLNQLQSMQLGGLWIEEAAPAIQEEIGKGVSEEVWGVGITSLRHPLMSEKGSEWLQDLKKRYRSMLQGTSKTSAEPSPMEIKEGLLIGAFVTGDDGGIVVRNRRAQITQNYPSEDHWTWVRFHEESTSSRALFRIPRGENVHVDEQYRETMAKALANRPDLLDRLVIGRPAHVQIGISVTPEYHETLNGGPWHRSDHNLDPMPNIPVFRFWDGDLHPACVFAQITPRGKFMVTDTLRGIETGEGMKQFVDTQVKPLIANRYYMIEKWRDLGDPTLADRDSSDSSLTAAKIIEVELNTHYEGGVVRLKGWSGRKEAMKDLLTRTLTDGEPMFVVSKHEKILHRALSGGWHYNKTSSGKVSDEPDNSDINSHPAAGLSHGIAKIFKYERESRFKLPASRKKIAVGSSVQPLYATGR